MNKIIFPLLLVVVFTTSLHAQNKFTLSGTVSDSINGEMLIGANVYIPSKKNGTITNSYGFYSITLPKEKYDIVYSFLGFSTVTKTINLNKDIRLNVELAPKSESIETVEILGERSDRNIQKVEMSTTRIQMKSIKTMPMLLGEVDVIKSIQLLPGVSTGTEGSTGFYVRGGNVDQNLVLLDDAPVYNASHAGGIFSVFNSDALKDVTLYKGGIPARFGGRLSSILDIHMKEGNVKRFSASGGVGLLSSRLTIESPIVKDKASFILSGRRTYADLFFPLLPDTNAQNASVFFHDFNAKINYRLNENNRFYLSGYFGRDVLDPGDFFKMTYGNTTTTFRWNHLFSDKLFSNFMFIYSDFDYQLGIPEGAFKFDWKSSIIDFNFKNDYTFYLNPKNTLRFGLGIKHHTFQPGQSDNFGNDLFKPESLPANHALDYYIFISNEHKITSLLSLEYGLRFSAFQNIGKGKYYEFDENYEVKDSTFYETGEIINTYINPEPRVSLRYLLGSTNSIKASYNRMAQYIHLATNSSTSTPLDVWFPSSPNIKPQLADQFALGYFHNFLDNKIETSMEVYYKNMINAIDFKNHAQLVMNPYLEGELRIGRAWSYGAELFLRKQTGDLTGWISYTLSRTMRDIPEISDKPFPAPYDKTHDISFVLSYDFNKRLNASANWVYATAVPRTIPTGRMEYQGMIAPVYSERNSMRIFDYHRLDLAVTLRNKEKNKKGKKRKFRSSWTFSLYNAYARKNPLYINFTQSADEPNKTEAEIMYLFRALPSITYNFNF